jgi:hypothetical protein
MGEESAADFYARVGDDASKWAAEFRATAIRLGYSDMDEGWLTGWFANAIEHSSDVRRWRADKAAKEPAEIARLHQLLGVTEARLAEALAERDRARAELADRPHSKQDSARLPCGLYSSQTCSRQPCVCRLSGAEAGNAAKAWGAMSPSLHDVLDPAAWPKKDTTK